MPDTHPDTPGGPGWDIRLGGLSLNGIHVTYDDEVSGLNLCLQLGTLEASIDKFDLDKKQFHVDELSLKNTIASVIQTKESPHDESQSADVEFGIGTISLANLHLNYENTVARERYGVVLGTSTLLAEKIDLPSRQIVLKEFLLENTDIVVLQPKRNGNKAGKSEATILPWVISLDHLILTRNSAQYDVHGAAQTKGLDPNHLRFDGLTMRAENIYFSENRITAAHQSYIVSGTFRP